VEALLGQAYCVWRASPEQAQALVAEALQLAKGDGKRPLALARALHTAGVDWYGVGQLPVAETLFQQALAIQEKLALNSLQMAATLNTLGNVAYARGELARAEQYYQQALAIQEKLAPNSLEMAGTLNNLGLVALDRGELDNAEQLHQQALVIREKLAPNSLEVAQSLNNLGLVALDRGELDKAAQLHQQALAIEEKLAPNSLEVAQTLHNLGNVALTRGELDKAEQLYQQALVIKKNVAPNSLEVAITLSSLGNVALTRGELDKAEQLYQQALVITENVAPNSLEVATTLNNLGAVAYNRGELDKAMQQHQRALIIREQIAPNSLEVAQSLTNLGNVAWARGELDKSERLYQQALEIRKKLAANSPPVADTLGNLGNVAWARGELDKAEQLYRQVLAIYEKFAPESLEVASALHNLGIVAHDRGKLVNAEEMYQRALAIREKLIPNSLDVAKTLHSLGVAALALGTLDKAEQLYRQALATQERIAPNSMDVAITLHSLGNLAQVRGDLVRAEQLYQQALAIQEKLAPNSLDIAGTLQNLATLARQQKNYPQAQQYLARALKIYETQRYAIQDPETRTAFGERYFDAYTLQALLALDQKQPQQAALALERSRARALTETLARRSLTLSDNAPQALKDLLAQQEQLQREYLLLAREQRKANANDTETVQRLQVKSRELAERQRELDQQLRQQFPTYASLLNPTPPSLQQVQSALDPDTVLLYHAFADKELLILAVSHQAVKGYRVKVDARALQEDLAEFRQLVSGVSSAFPKAPRTASERAEMLTLGQRLYTTLIKPAEASLKNAKTVLLCPEGDLNLLPWGALVVAVDKQGRPTYWIERVALGVVPSAGVYRQARESRPASRGAAIAAVSQYSRQQVAQAKTEQLVRRSGEALDDLPWIAQEVEQLQQLLRALGVVVAQEGDATPEWARQMAQEARVVHLACHAEADGVDPLGSWLALAPAGAPAGKLTAAEVVGKWRLQADVVMLSACATAVGVLRPYEGLYGLARAFLYVGARSVGASLWQVSDASTARLMGAFYREYVRGVGKAEALRRAQVELLRSEGHSDPYFWAGFVLIGAER
jgi:CHAT domain-containing protein/Tfp pilus assembly protein PilF